MPSNTSNRTTTKKFLSPLRPVFRKRPEVIEAINNLLEVIDNTNIWHRDTTQLTVYPRVPIIVINEFMKDCGGFPDDERFAQILAL